MLPGMPKLVEKIMKSQWISGFRRGYSCATALLNIADNILRSTDNEKCIALILVDFSNAFDKVGHNVL